MRYALIGAAGYIAPRHMDALTRAGGELVLACDLSDSVGVLDRYAPTCAFTTDPHVFWEKLHGVDTLIICTPNDTHAAMATAAANHGIRVIVEKPMTLPGDEVPPALDPLITPVAQLRYAPVMTQLRQHVRQQPKKHYIVDVTYNTFRGPWYQQSWKSDPVRSGGLLMNLGIHFFDLCHWIWGNLITVIEHESDGMTSKGQLELDHATVRWRLSTAGSTARTLSVDGIEIDLSKGMTELHHRLYEDHEAGKRACMPDEARRAIETIRRVVQA